MMRRRPQSGLQRHSVGSNGSSSISSYSAPWPQTGGPGAGHHRNSHHRPLSYTQLQTHSSWLTEDLTVEEGPHLYESLLEDDNVVESSWQEEAHWMSFRNAVQSFAVQQQQQDRRRRQHGEPILDDSDQTRSFHSAHFQIQPPIGESLSSSLDSSSVRQTPARHQRRRERHSRAERSNVMDQHSWELVGPLGDGVFGSGTTNNAVPALQVDTTRATPTITSTFSSSTTPSTALKVTSTTAAAASLLSATAAPSSSHLPMQGPSNNSDITNMASYLAETKMRLALAEAERDELEFALIQGTSERSGQTNSTSR